jgi:hypothetical protein
LGKVSQEQTRILGINDFLDLRTEYDLYGRIAETRTNHIGLLNDNSADRVTYDYDYADDLVSSSRDHKYPNYPTLSITNEMTWDQSGRQIDHYLNIGGQRTHISKQAYTVKDQLREKNLGNSTFTALQSLDYTYLSNGFLRCINHVQTEANDWFKLGIHYDQPDGLAITGFTSQYWRHEYAITDHLGNTHLDGNSQIDSTEILDEIAYLSLHRNQGLHQDTENSLRQSKKPRPPAQ